MKSFRKILLITTIFSSGIAVSTQAQVQAVREQSANSLNQLEIRELLEEMTSIPTFNASIRISPRWERPINFFINFPNDLELKQNLITQLQRLNSEIKELPKLNIDNKISRNQGNFIIESIKDNGIDTATQSGDLELLPGRSCIAKVERDKETINQVFVLVRQSVPRSRAMQCMLNIILTGFGIYDPNRNSEFFGDSLLNPANAMLITYNSVDFTLLRYLYAKPNIPSDLSGMARVMSSLVYKNRPQIRPVISEFYRNFSRRPQIYSDLVRLMGSRESLIYLSLIMNDRTGDLFQIVDRSEDEWQEPFFGSITDEDLSFLKGRCRSCYFAVVFYKIHKMQPGLAQSEFRELLKQAREMYEPSDGPLIQSRLLYYESLADFLNVNTGSKLNAVLSLIKIYEGERRPYFIYCKHVLGLWEAKRNTSKAAKTYRELRAMYDGTIIPPVAEAELLRSTISFFVAAGRKEEARVIASEARKRFEKYNYKEGLTRLEAEEHQLQ